MKRFLSIVLSLSMVLTLCTPISFAAEGPVYSISEEEYPGTDDRKGIAVTVKVTSDTEFYPSSVTWCLSYNKDLVSPDYSKGTYQTSAGVKQGLSVENIPRNSGLEVGPDDATHGGYSIAGTSSSDYSPVKTVSATFYFLQNRSKPTGTAKFSLSKSHYTFHYYTKSEAQYDNDNNLTGYNYTGDIALTAPDLSAELVLPVTSVTLTGGITPVKNETIKDKTLSVAKTDDASVNVAWKIGNESVTVSDDTKFLGSTAYTAVVTVSPKEGKTLADNPNVVWDGVTMTEPWKKSDNNWVGEVTFNDTEARAINSIKSVALAEGKTGGSFTDGETLKTDDLTVTAAYDDGFEGTIASFIIAYPDEHTYLWKGNNTVTVTAGGKSGTLTVSGVQGRTAEIDKLFTFTGGTSRVYNGGNQAEALAALATVNSAPDNVPALTVTPTVTVDETAKDVAEYAVHVSFTGDAHYADVTSGSLAQRVSITAKTLAVTVDGTTAKLVKDKSATLPAITYQDGSENVTGTIVYTLNSTSYDGEEALRAALTEIAKGAVGDTAVVGWTLTADGNWSGTVSGQITFTVVALEFAKKVSGELSLNDLVTVTNGNRVYGNAWSNIVTLKDSSANLLTNTVQVTQGGESYTGTNPQIYIAYGSSETGESLPDASDAALYSVRYKDDEHPDGVTILDGTVEIARRELTVTGFSNGAITKVYDGTKSAVEWTENSYTPTVAGNIVSNEVKIVATPGEFPDATAGGDKTVAVALAIEDTASGSGRSANYTLKAESFNFTTASITQRPLTVIPGEGFAVTKEYDGTNGWEPAEATDTTLTFATAEGDTGVVGGDDVGATLTNVTSITGTNVDVGTGYTVTVKGTFTLTGKASANYRFVKGYDSDGIEFTGAQITKVKQNAFFNSSELGALTRTWDGEAKTAPSVQSLQEEPVVTYTYQVNGEGDWVSAQPTDVGTHKVRASFPETKNYDAGKLEGEFTITKKLIAKPTASETKFTYNGGMLTYDAATPDGSTVSGNTQTNAGTYTVTYTLNDAKNTAWNNGSGEAETDTTTTLSWVIQKASAAIDQTNAAVAAKTYDGKTNATVTGLKVTGVDSAELGFTAVGTFDNKNAGTDKTVTVAVTLDDAAKTNYVFERDSSSKTITLSGKGVIEKKAVTIEWGNTSFTYNGKEQKPTAVVRGLIDADVGDVTATVTNGATNAGDYTATASVSGEPGESASGNYVLGGDATQAFTIAKAPVKVTGVRADWNSSGHKVVFSGAKLEGLVAADAEKVRVTFADSNITESGSHALSAAQMLALASLVKAGSGNAECENYQLTEVNATTVDIPLEDVQVKAAEVEAAETVEGVSATDVSAAMGNSKVKIGDTTDGDNGITAAAQAIASSAGVIDEAKAKVEAAKESANDTVKGVLEASNDSNPIVIIIKPIIAIVVQAVNKTNEAVKSFKVDITPKFELLATTKNIAGGEAEISTNTNAVKVGELGDKSPTKAEVKRPTKLSIPVPDNFSGHTVYVKHHHGSVVFEYLASVSGSSNAYYAEFENPNGFSEFELSLEPSSNVVIKETGATYETLQAALNAVENGQTVTVNKSIALTEDVTVNRAVSFTLEIASGASITGGTIAAGSSVDKTAGSGTAAGKYTFEAKPITLTVTSTYSIPAAVEGTAVSVDLKTLITAGTAPYTFKTAASSNADWLTLNPDTGVLSGTRPQVDADTADYSNYTITVKDAQNSGATITVSVGKTTDTPAPQSNNTGAFSSGGGGGGTAAGTSSSITPTTSVSGSTATVGNISDSALGAAARAGKVGEPITIDVSKAGAGVTTVALPAGLAAKVAALSGTDGMKISLPSGDLTLNDTALKAISGTNGGEVSISLSSGAVSALSSAQQSAVSGMTVAAAVSASLAVGDKPITSFGGGSATLSVPFTPAAGTNAADYVVYYISSEGSLERMPTTYSDGKIRFTTTHFSDYIVVYEPRVKASFADVASGAWYYDAVNWAVDKHVTDGMGDDRFQPETVCTRAQMVTFLWRAAGSPEPASSVTFEDVVAGSWYGKAVQWAVENRITVGKDGGFKPDDKVTRAEAVTFLYRAFKGVGSSVNSFNDVASNAWYAEAVNWAVEQRITDGMGDNRFQPGTNVTRAMAVTFLYRGYQK